MKVGYAARWSPLDKRSWSGICYYTYQQIKKHNEVEIFHFKWTWRVREWLTMQKSMNRKLFKKNTSVEYLRSYAKYFSKQLEKELKKRPVDVLFVCASPQLVAYIKTDIPIIYMSDATFQQLQGYYPMFSNLAEYNIRQGIELDKKALQNAAHCLLTSEWNRQSAIKDYGIDPAKISVVTLGANLQTIPAANEVVNSPSGQCRLLFLGVEWERKGGDIALETYKLLQQKGLEPTLHIIGCVPPYDLSADKNITVIPFLDKNKEEDFKKLDRIFKVTDFLLLPTRAECSGVVFSEASAFGVPSITTDTGGVSTTVINGVNGYTLPFAAGADSYAATIEKIMSDKPQWAQLKQTSRQQFDIHMSWDIWGKRFQQVAQEVIKG